VSQHKVLLAICGVLVWFVLMSVIIIGSIREVKTMSETVMTVTPSAPVVTAGQQFTVTVAITPGTGVSIAGAQFNLGWNPAAVQVNSVAEGTIFKATDPNTYFMPGTINNTNGTLVNVADAMEGAGESVTAPGSLAVITCTALTAGTTSAFTISNAIVGRPAGVAVPLSSPTINQAEIASVWDLNLDGTVNAADMVICAGFFGQTGTPGWIPEDFLKAGVITVLDLILIGQNFGAT